MPSVEIKFSCEDMTEASALFAKFHQTFNTDVPVYRIPAHVGHELVKSTEPATAPEPEQTAKADPAPSVQGQSSDYDSANTRRSTYRGKNAEQVATALMESIRAGEDLDMAEYEKLPTKWQTEIDAVLAETVSVQASTEEEATDEDAEDCAIEEDFEPEAPAKPKSPTGLIVYTHDNKVHGEISPPMEVANEIWRLAGSLISADDVEALMQANDLTISALPESVRSKLEDVVEKRITTLREAENDPFAEEEPEQTENDNAAEETYSASDVKALLQQLGTSPAGVLKVREILSEVGAKNVSGIEEKDYARVVQLAKGAL